MADEKQASHLFRGGISISVSGCLNDSDKWAEITRLTEEALAAAAAC